MHLVNKIGTGLESFISRLPAGRCGFVASHRFLQGLHLSYQFIDIAAHWLVQDLNSLEHTIGIYNEFAAQIYLHIFVINIICFSYLTTGVCQQWIGNPTIYQFGKLLFLPDLMCKVAVNTYSQNLGLKVLKLIVLDGNCRQFCRSDEGKVAGIEKEHLPLSVIILQRDLLKILILISHGREVRYRFSHFQHMNTSSRYDFTSS